jgi:hypothetical protein
MKTTRQKIRDDWQTVQNQMLDHVQHWDPSNLPPNWADNIDPFLRDMEGNEQDEYEIGELVTLLALMTSQGLYLNKED